MTATITLTRPTADVAELTFDMPNKSANILSSHVLNELEKHLDTLESEAGLAGLVIRSGKPGTFIAGADLREFVQSLDVDRDQIVTMCRRGRILFARLAALPAVTVAAIDGICVGGGAELAIWCDRRILSNSAGTQFGFPEVKLGLFPGWGGTVRTPRIVGLYNAVELITSGDSLGATAAVEMGLATQSVAADELCDAAIRLIRAEQQSGSYREDRIRWSQPIEMSETELGFLGVTASGFIQQKTKGHYPAPLAALEVLLGGATTDADAAGEMESEQMAELFGSPVNRALLNVFFLTDRNKKETGQATAEVPVGKIRSVGVIGAGIMGQGIAAANVKRELPAVISDTCEDALRNGVQGILEEVSYSRELKGPDVKRAVHFASLLTTATQDIELAECDLVIEAVVERADVKQEVYARLEAQLSEEAILATNTSTLPIRDLAANLAHPDRFLGIHFFNPVRKMPLVEIIRGSATSDFAIATAVAYAKHIKKSPIVVQDGPGFLVNRLLLPYMSEAVELLLEGASPKSIDRAATRFGMPMGPLHLYDVVGLDVAAHAGETMLKAFPDRVIASPLLADLVAAGRLGQKTGRGFYSYDNKKRKPQADQGLQPLVAACRKQDRDIAEEEMTDRLLLPMLLEATRALDAGVVEDARNVDLGLILGIGFPPFRGGLLFWADTLGAKTVLEKLKPYQSLGCRYEPTDRLLDMARTGGTFYDNC